MAKKGDPWVDEITSCSICLYTLTDPVTTPCGHNFCMNCIKYHWDKEDRKRIYSCPRCRETFTRRPALHLKTAFQVFVDGLTTSHRSAGPEVVFCDFCTTRKLKAIKSCLVCLVSYCERHLQSHYNVARFRKHTLVEPSKNLQEDACSRHGEAMKMFCRTDRQCICYLCSLEEHKGHDVASAAAERTERRRDIRQSIQGRRRDVKALRREVEEINGSADTAAEDSEAIFTELIRLVEERRRDVEQLVRSQQQTEVSRVEGVREKLEQEIAELERLDSEVDGNHFLHHYPSVSALGEPPHSSGADVSPLQYFEDVTAAVSQLRDQLQDVLGKAWSNISPIATGDVSLSEAEPKTRAALLRYSRELTMDPSTANERLLLSDGNRRAQREDRSYSSHPDRFDDCPQVLSREGLTGRTYWEVERKGLEVYVAVSYRSIRRKGASRECLFGYNDKSWRLACFSGGYRFHHNSVNTPVSGPRSCRVGVYLDHSAGILSFYSVSETMTLLHRVRTTFTEPLYAGLWFMDKTTAKFSRLK